MFLHIGAEKEILCSNIILILNIASIKESDITKKYIDKFKENGIEQYITKDEPKSIVIVYEKHQYYLYYSPISSLTLLNRLNSHDYINYLN